MTFWTYLFVNTVLSLTVTAILIWTKPENRAKLAEAKMRREEDLFNMILEAAKRIDEERKPNPEFAPPQTRHSGGYQPKPSGMPKPPTTGTSAIEPKKRKYDEYSALPYAAGTVQRFCKPILTSAIVLAEEGKIVIPTEVTGTPVSGYGDGKIYGYVQTLTPDDGNDDGKAYSINPRTGEVEGYPAIDGTVYRVYFWTSGKAVQAVHVRPQSGREKFEAAFEALKDAPITVYKDAPITVYNPAEESVKRYEARTAQLPHYCGNCIAHSQEKFDGEIIHVCMRHKVWLHNQERWDGGCDAWEPSPAICKLYKEWADGFCSSCKYFEPEEPGQKRGMGLCARNDEIKMMGQSCTGYARKGELPKYLERKPMERPEPLGTITTH